MKNRTLSEMGDTTRTTVLRDGRHVWIKTLNRLQKGKVMEEAKMAASKACRRFLPEKEDHIIQLEVFQEASQLQLGSYMASHDYWLGNLNRQVEEQLPYRLAPDPEEIKDEVEYGLSLESYEQHVLEVDEQREVEYQRLFEEKRLGYAEMERADLIERCMHAWYLRLYAAEFSEASMAWTLYHAVRLDRDHSVMAFKNIQEIIDLDDNERTDLERLYEEADDVEPEEVPTSPVTS